MASVSLKDDRIQFRHPLVLDRRRHGIIIKKRLSKVSRHDQEQARLDLEKLLEQKPHLRSDVSDKICDLAKDIYFAPLTAKNKEIEGLLTSVALTRFQQLKGDLINKFLYRKGVTGPYIPPDLNEEFIDDLVDQIFNLRASYNDALKTDDEKQNIIEGLQKATGAQTAEQKAITLQECMTHFSARVSCASELAKYKLIHRVQLVVDSLGPNTKHFTLTKKAIEDAIKDTKPRSVKEGDYRARDMRRFFRLLSEPTVADGLGLQNPFAGPKVRKKGKRRAAGAVEVLNPANLLKNKRLSPYWKAVVAVIGFGGLRLAEAASIEWDRVDEKTGIIKIRPTDFYPELKSSMSNRDVMPFTNLWPILKEYRKETARHDRLVFDRDGDQGPTWFRTYRGQPTAADMSRALINAIGAAEGMKCKMKDETEFVVSTVREKKGKYLLRFHDSTKRVVKKDDVAEIVRPKEPARRLRRYWETTMRAKGFGSLIEAMGGHDDKIGLMHYTKFEDVVAAAKIGKV